jgi:hypothetical protein
MNSGKTGEYNAFAHIGIADKKYLHDLRLTVSVSLRENVTGHAESDGYITPFHFDHGWTPQET